MSVILVWVLVLNFRNESGIIVGEYKTMQDCEYAAAQDVVGDYVGHYCIRKPKQ